ncbi:MAG: phosphatase PAP2 family protein [Bacteroidia bacterium]|nr:phosphatase PAP2 family protein [Bacteroidia bacterium]
METLEKLDRQLFFFLNGNHNDFFDHVFWYTSLVVTWIPLYLFFIFLIIKKYKSKCWVPFLGAALLIGLSDKSSVLIKNSVERYRPSHNLEIKEKVLLLKNDSGGQFGFVSSHAANVFGIAVYLILLLKFRKKYFNFLLLFWALFVSYSRIYGGLHYPSDIFGGAILGSLLAFMVFKLQQFILKKYFHFQIT